jgi:hypothetical protein
MADQVIQQAGGQITEKFDQYLWYIGRPIAGCPWNGAAEQGRAARPTQHSFYNASMRCSTLAQEPGHNFGMVHSSAWSARTAAASSRCPPRRPASAPTSSTATPSIPWAAGAGT